MTDNTSSTYFSMTSCCSALIVKHPDQSLTQSLSSYYLNHQILWKIHAALLRNQSADVTVDKEGSVCISYKGLTEDQLNKEEQCFSNLIGWAKMF